nr:MAG TPA: hypothetical protein [Caudoviricetes sp.]
MEYIKTPYNANKRILHNTIKLHQIKLCIKKGYPTQ